MKASQSSSTPTNLSLLFQKLSNSNSLKQCNQIHALLVVSDAISDVYFTNNLLNLYSNCPNIAHARFLFDESLQRNVVTWTSMITGYVRRSAFESALWVFKTMIREAQERPNQFTYSVSVRACMGARSFQLGLQIHALVLRSGFENDGFAGSALVDMYCKMGRLGNALRVFDGLMFKDLVSWNLMIAGFAEIGDVEAVMRMFDEMRWRGLEPNGFTMSSLLKCCRFTREIERIHGFVVKNVVVELDKVLGGALVDAYGKCGDVKSSRRLLDCMVKKDAFAWSSMISNYVKCGSGEKAVILFKEICGLGEQSDEHVLSGALKACVEMGEIDLGTQIHSHIVKFGYGRNCLVSSILLDLYSDFGRIVDAEKLFRRILNRDRVSWNSMIAAYALFEDYVVECLKLFCEFQRSEGMKPDGMTFVAVLRACSSGLDLCRGLQIHAQIIKSSYSSETYVSNAVIDMYAKCNSINDAQRAFETMVCRDEASWSSIIGSYAHVGEELKALKLWKDMFESGVHPSSFSFPLFLSACSNLASVDSGKQCHSLIIKSAYASEVYTGTAIVDLYAKCGSMDDSIKSFLEICIPNTATFNALILGLAEHGHVREAINIFYEIEKMGIKPDKITFIALLSGCRHAGLLDESLIFFDIMQLKYAIEPGTEHYACLVDAFGRTGRLDEAYDMVLRTQAASSSASIWKALLGACLNYKNLTVGVASAKKLMELEPHDHAPYVLLSNLYSSTGRWEKALELRDWMAKSGVLKDPGSSQLINRNSEAA
ncbi:Pentatricopeptide repeat-containing protein [Acorus calamus]|uniref:Pentatricopeptide repeat-containing protein n=1 Tax=Acorus calamus TaxID=4465 RepID=A0AAV9D4E3_ACOCL|nr:Pentatricopeptide repeat-containing protein [Acorus calamus]